MRMAAALSLYKDNIAIDNTKIIETVELLLEREQT